MGHQNRWSMMDGLTSYTSTPSIVKELLSMLCDNTLKQWRMVNYTAAIIILHAESGRSLSICKLHHMVPVTLLVPTSQDPSQHKAEAAA